MRVLHFILGRANPDTSNGVNKVINGHAKFTNLHGHTVTVIGLCKSQKEKVKTTERNGFYVKSFRCFFRGILPEIINIKKNHDIVHLHSVWNTYNLIIACYLLKEKIPFIITPHSGLTEDRLKQSKYIFKRLYHHFLQKPIFDRASGIHALTREESTCLNAMTKNNNIFYVPNGLDHTFTIEESKLNHRDVIKLGFLGRLSKEKNIVGLILSLKYLDSSVLNNLQLDLIGPFDNNEQELRDLVENLGFKNIVNFKGPLYGAEKNSALRELDIYIHPAFSDVVSLAVMEAMQIGLPSIVSRTSDMSYFYNSGAFVMIEPNSKDIARGINEIIYNKDDWNNMKHSALNLSRTIFNWNVSVPMLIKEYLMILKNR